MGVRCCEIFLVIFFEGRVFRNVEVFCSIVVICFEILIVSSWLLNCKKVRIDLSVYFLMWVKKEVFRKFLVDVLFFVKGFGRVFFYRRSSWDRWILIKFGFKDIKLLISI